VDVKIAFMAVIEKRGDGQWRARIRKVGFPGTSKTFTLRRDAETWARTTELKIERREFVDATTAEVSFSEVAQRYKAEVSPLKRTGRAEGYRIDRLIGHFGKYSLNGIRPLDIANYRDKRLKEVSGQTVLHDLNTLSAILEHCRKDWGVHLVENPVKAIRKPATGRSRDRRVSHSEVEYLRLAADSGQVRALRPIIDLAIETSCRLGELIGLQWDAVNLKKRTLFLSDTKNGESRTVALSTAAVASLSAMPRQISGRLFENWRGSDAFQPTWRKCVARAKRLYAEDCAKHKIKPDKGFLEDFRFHDLRHEATSRLFERGLNPFEVASMTGHKSMQMLKRYTHVEAEKLAAKLG
jgi:integrase